MAYTPTVPTKDRAIIGNLGLLIKTGEAAELMNVSEHHVRVMCERGEIQAVKVGRVWRINRDALLEQLGIREAV